MIDANNLSIGYEGKKIAQNINFHIDSGSYLSIVGENGAGKSTLIKTILGLKSPMSGEINFARKGIGYLPQQSLIQKDFPGSVWEIVLSGNIGNLKFKPFYSKHDKETALFNLKKMDIFDLKNKCYRDLSGGQQQRVLLARALCASSEILILDEPVTGLDPKVTKDFYELIAKINKEGITIIMVSHDLQGILNYTSHILHVKKDNSFFGTKEDFLNSPNARNLGIYNNITVTCEEMYYASII